MRLPPFQDLLDRNREAVYRFLVAAVGHQDADDCFQETFLAALRAYPRLERADNLRGWLLTIARNKALDHHRRQAQHPVPTDRMPEAATPAADPDHTEVWSAVRRLPAKQMSAVIHRFVNDLPYRDIARLLDCSEEAARRNVHEALKKLRGATHE
jgi:RNA polymerase sigma factor (sigma-70 family)